MDADRLKHSIVVTRKMIEIGRIYNLNEIELQDLFVLGFNHDIGYEYGNNSKHAHTQVEIYLKGIIINIGKKSIIMEI